MKNVHVLGEWRLPELARRYWSALAGNDHHLYVTSVGERDGEDPELWRFPMPASLQLGGAHAVGRQKKTGAAAGD